MVGVLTCFGVGLQKDKLRVMCDLFEGRCVFKHPIAEAREASASLRMRVMTAAKGAAAAAAEAAASTPAVDEFAGLAFSLTADNLDCVAVVAAGALSTSPSEVGAAGGACVFVFGALCVCCCCVCTCVCYCVQFCMTLSWTHAALVFAARSLRG